MAPLSGKFEMEVELGCSADKFWEGIMCSNEIYPKIFSEEFKSIEVIKGDGKSTGSVRKVVFTEAIPHITTVIEKINFVNEASKTFAYSMIDGDLTKYFKVFKSTLVVVSKGHGCIAKWTLVYEKVNKEPPAPEVFGEKAKKGFEALSAYMLQS